MESFNKFATNGEKESARKVQHLCGRKSGIGLGLLLLGRGSGLGSLGSLGLGHALLELVDAAGGVYEALLAGVEGVADVADTDENRGFGGAGLDRIAAGATNF